MEYKLDIQYFGGDVITFDEILEDKTYQSEFDKRVTKAIQTATEKHEKKIAKLEEWQTKYEQLQEDYTELEANKEQELSKVQKQNTLDKALRDSETVDVDLLKLSVLDFVEQAEYKDGEIVGLADKIEELKEAKPILFTKVPTATGAGHTKVPVDKQTDKDILFKSMGIKTK